jgi:hypothetical protein
MRIVEKYEIDKLVRLLEKIGKRYIPPFKQSALYPDYMFWSQSGSEQSKMYKTIYATPALLAEAEKLISTL